MRYLGIDYGKKNVGIALSDLTGRLAFPLKVLKNSARLASAIKEICESEEIEAVVIGESHNLSGRPNPIMAEILDFKKELQNKIQKKVYLEPEYYTSVESRRLQGETNMTDASAAAIILQSFLEKAQINADRKAD